MISLLLVFTGGMVGAVSRFEISRHLNKKIPFGTGIANFTGGLLLGYLIHLQSQGDIPEWVWLLLATGFCGGYTTYSTFSYEAFQLYKEGRIWRGVAYVFLSIVLTGIGIVVILMF
ncbi:fluoride efflux transporter CrcB [Halobacillus fulvus]|nr:fluoride efflux transporter CrcB [Halobacillus fulvus]